VGNEFHGKHLALVLKLNLYFQTIGAKMQNMVYDIAKEKKLAAPDLEKITNITDEIIEMANNAPHGAWKDYVDADIAEIICEILKN